MFGFFKRKSRDNSSSDRFTVIAHLNARVQPIDRGDYFEDPLDEILKSAELGEVTGGGTQLTTEPDGIAYCDIEIIASDLSEATIQKIITTLEELGAPKGSILKFQNGHDDIAFGRLEGMAVFLNGTDLAAEVYAQSDINELIKQFETILDGIGRFRGYWEGSRETALYFYGDCFDAMKISITELLATVPLCGKARVVKIA